MVMDVAISAATLFIYFSIKSRPTAWLQLHIIIIVIDNGMQKYIFVYPPQMGGGPLFVTLKFLTKVVAKKPLATPIIYRKYLRYVQQQYDDS